MVQLLAEMGGAKDKVDEDGRTAYNGHVDVVKLLIGMNADMDKADNGGRTPLY